MRFEEEHFEGQQRERYSSYYERDPRLRAKAITLHGTTCVACGFDFEKKYGEYGKDYIEVHHIKPVSELGGNTRINPQTDMAVLCSNCHRIVHRKRERVLSIDELKRSIVVV
ncbi:MAG: HNH endonuclease [Desulfuromonadales bacterium]|nr:HNH endonuclease [Desulfuromonadales bacterium]